MDREQLMACIENLTDCGATADGEFLDNDGGRWDVSDVESGIADLLIDVKNMRKVLAWAKLAPLRVEQGAAAGK